MYDSPRPFFPENTRSHPSPPQSDIQIQPDAHRQRIDQIYPSDNWNQGNTATVASLDTFADNDKNDANNRHLDSEMADHATNSRGPTPQSNSSYNHSSSNTSYSPSQAHEDDQNASSGGSRYMIGFAPPPHDTTFTGEGIKHAMSSSAQQQEDLFTNPAGWDLGTGMTPGSGMSLTGMTPDGGWEKLMDSMGWQTGRNG